MARKTVGTVLVLITALLVVASYNADYEEPAMWYHAQQPGPLAKLLSGIALITMISGALCFRKEISESVLGEEAKLFARDLFRRDP